MFCRSLRCQLRRNTNHNTALSKHPQSLTRHTNQFCHADNHSSLHLMARHKVHHLLTLTTYTSTRSFRRPLTHPTNQTNHATTHSSFHSTTFHRPCSTFPSHLMSFTHTSSHHYLLPRGYLPPTPFTLETILGLPRHVYSTDFEVALHLCVAGVSYKISLKIPSLANSPQPTTRTPMATFLRPHLPPPARSFKSALNTHH